MELGSSSELGVKRSEESQIRLYGKSNENLSTTAIDNPDFSKSTFLNHPKYAQYFKKRICIKFIPDPKSDLCLGCLRKVNEGFHRSVGTEWTYESCTKPFPTDAYGKLTFPGSHSKTANYIRIQNETDVKDMIQYMYSPEGWNLQRPQLILSVTGGAQKFTIPHRMKKAFKRGLIKAAASTGAWIITGGTNTGVMRLVGEAVADEFHTCDLTVLGIATWGKIAFRNQMIKKGAHNLNTISLDEINNKDGRESRENGNIYKKIVMSNKRKRLKKLILKSLEMDNNLMFQTPLFYAPQENDPSMKEKNPDVLLDPNHTHFILVDDGTEGQFGKEIEFRAQLEAELQKGKSLRYYETKREMRLKTSSKSFISDQEDENDSKEIDKTETVPMILIVVQGGPNTLITVEHSLRKSVPVLVLADSRGCADLIANACSLSKPDDEQFAKLITESKMFEHIKDPVGYKNKIKEAVERLKYIISKLSDNLINIFRLDSEEGGSDIELTILRAFLNSRKNEYYENLKLSLQWNRNDIAKTDIFTGEEEFKSHELNILMEMALIQNKPEFVELLLENGVNLKSFLTVRRLCFFYNSAKIQSEAKKAPLFQLFKKKYSYDHRSSIITFKGLVRFLKDNVFEDFEPKFLPTDLDYNQIERFLFYANKKESSELDSRDCPIESTYGRNEVPFPEENLFLWAILLNRIEIAIIFWQIGEHQIISALFASKLIRSMSSKLTDLEKELNRYANDFENMAIGVLNIFDGTTDDLINGVILLRKIPMFNLDCLQMAVEADCQKFVSLSSVQNLLTDIWLGKVTSKSGSKATIKFILSCLSFGLLAPFLAFGRREKFTNLSDRESTLKKLAIYNKKKNLSNLLRSYLANNQVDDDKKDAHLMPRCCRKDDSSSSSEGDSSDDDSTDTDNESNFYNEFESVTSTMYETNLSHKLSTKMVTAPKKFKKKKKYVRRSKWSTYVNRYLDFVQSPRVHFVNDTIFYMIFLMLFNYMILCEFNYYETVDAYLPINSTETESFENQTVIENNSTTDANQTIEYVTIGPQLFEKVQIVQLKQPSIIEYILMYWIFCFIAEEVRQVIYLFGDTEAKVLRNKLAHYFANSWNYLDISGCLVFSIGMSLRFLSLKTTESLFVSARIILCIDLLIWYLRLLHVSIVFKSLGPKLVMIQKMIRDLMFFVSIIAMFVSSFGVTTQATMYPGNKLSVQLFRNILNKAYWPIYGEMKLLDEMDDCPNDESTTCPETSGIVFSFIALMIYMIVANVLLLNLLIAMFSSTFQDVQENTDQIWKFQRYRLVFEYYDSPILPPPMNLIAYVVSFIQFLGQKRKNYQNKGNMDSAEDDGKDDIDMLLDRERKFAEEYVRMEKVKIKESMESRLKINSERLEALEQKLNEVMDSKVKENNQMCNAINWIMSELDQDKNRAPLINTNVRRKPK